MPHFLPREEGQGLAEYALILSLVALLVIGVVAILGGALRDQITFIGKLI